MPGLTTPESLARPEVTCAPAVSGADSCCGPDGTDDRRRRIGILDVVLLVARDRFSRVLFSVIAIIALALYTLLLPAGHTMQVAFANWTQLTTKDVTFSLLLGLSMAAVVTVQVFAFRLAAVQHRAAAGKATSNVFGLAASIAPGLCCTAVLPAVLGIVGVGAAGSASVATAVAPYADVIRIASLILVLAIGWSSLRRLAIASGGKIGDRGADE